MKEKLNKRPDYFNESLNPANLSASLNLSAPLNLPEGETLNASKNEISSSPFTNSDNQYSPPLEGSGEAERRTYSDELNKTEISEHPKYQTANAKTYRFTKEFKHKLTRNPTEPEKIMWQLLRNKKTGYKIRRQHIIDDFIVDFVCLSNKLVIEIDGKIHQNQKEYDEERTMRLQNCGFEVIRFSNEEVYADSESVFLKIKEKLDTLMLLSISLPL